MPQPGAVRGAYGAPQGGQPAQAPAGYAPQTPSNMVPNDGRGLAIGALICGIVAFLFGWTVIGGIACGIAALVLAHMRSKRYKAMYPVGGPSKAKEIAGRILGILGIVEAVIVALLTVFGIALFGAAFDQAVQNGMIDYDGNGNITLNAEIGEDGNITFGNENEGSNANTNDEGDQPQQQSAPASSDTTVSPVPATEDNPAKVGEWITTTQYSTTDSADHLVYYRITGVESDQARVQEAIDAYNNADHLMTIEPLEDDDMEYMLVDYEVYFPTDFPANEYGGLYMPSMYWSLKGANGDLVEHDGLTYIGLSGQDLTEDPENAQPGDTVKGSYLFASVKGVNDYRIESYYSDLNTDESIYTYVNISK